MAVKKKMMLNSYAVTQTISKACTAFVLFWVSAGSGFNSSCRLQISTHIFYHYLKELHSIALYGKQSVKQPRYHAYLRCQLMSSIIS